MKKILSIFIVIPFFLTACGKTEAVVTTTPPKTPFIVETYSVGKKMESYTVEKSARLTAGSSLTLSTDSAGEITNITVKEGQRITKGMTLVTLKDTVNSYDIRLAQAQNGLTTQDASIASTKISLDKAIADTQVAYEQARRSYDTLLAKNPLTYDTLVNANQKTIDNLDASYQIYLSDMEKNMDSILYEADRILGLSTAFEYSNNVWEPYLGARRGDLKAISDSSYGKALAKLGEIKAMKGVAMTPENANTQIKAIEDAYVLIRKHVDDMIYMIQNNVVGAGLSQTQNDAWINQWNGFRSLIQSSNTAFTNWKTTTNTFLKNYKTNELAVKVALESLSRELTLAEKELIQKSPEAKLLYDQNIIDLKDRIKAAELSLKQAETARDTAIKTKDATLAQLSASRNSTVLSVDQARRDYSKLSVTSPFEGTVTKVMATVWQRTNMGTPVLEIASNTPEIVVDLDADIASRLTTDAEVAVKVAGNTFSGNVIAISRKAWSNLLYPTRISIPKASKYIGSAATIIFTGSKEVISDMPAENILLPLKSVKIISEQEGQIALLGSGNILTYKTIQLGRVSGYGVEVKNVLDPSLEIILTDVENYNAEKNILVKKVK